MLNRILLLVALALTYLTISNCKGCKENPCTWEYEQENGVCKCPKEKYESVGVCRALKPDEYFGRTTGCDCQDSSFFWIRNKRFDASVGKTLVTIEQVSGVEDSPALDIDSSNFVVIPMPDGDSLWGASISSSRCPVQGYPSIRKFAARYKSRDTIKLYMYSETAFAVGNKYLYDTCVYILHK
jgi:hypothetical protein